MLDFGIDVTNPLRPAPFFYDTTGVTLLAKVLGRDIEIETSLGSVIGILIKDGEVTVDRDGDPETNPNNPTPDRGVEFSVLLNDTNGDDRIYLSENLFTTDIINVSLNGGLEVSLPIFALQRRLAMRQRLQMPVQGRERRAQVVRHVGDDLAMGRLLVSLLANLSFNAIHSSIERSRDGGDLVAVRCGSALGTSLPPGRLKRRIRSASSRSGPPWRRRAGRQPCPLSSGAHQHTRHVPDSHS